MKLQEQIGMGSGAEVYNGTFKGQEVAIKLLTNQNTTEESNLSLRYIAATLSKVEHPNILKFRGMVVDPPHICIVTEQMQTSLFKFYGTNNPFPMSEKLRIAKSVATAMVFI